MAEAAVDKGGFWKTFIILMCFAATFVCYIDRVNISVAIIPMAEEFIIWKLRALFCRRFTSAT